MFKIFDFGVERFFRSSGSRKIRDRIISVRWILVLRQRTTAQNVQDGTARTALRLKTLSCRSRSISTR